VLDGRRAEGGDRRTPLFASFLQVSSCSPPPFGFGRCYGPSSMRKRHCAFTSSALKHRIASCIHRYYRYGMRVRALELLQVSRAGACVTELVLMGLLGGKARGGCRAVVCCRLGSRRQKFTMGSWSMDQWNSQTPLPSSARREVSPPLDSQVGSFRLAGRTVADEGSSQPLGEPARGEKNSTPVTAGTVESVRSDCQFRIECRRIDRGIQSETIDGPLVLRWWLVSVNVKQPMTDPHTPGARLSMHTSRTGRQDPCSAQWPSSAAAHTASEGDCSLSCQMEAAVQGWWRAGGPQGAGDGGRGRGVARSHRR
jgi:hypothetical protein